MGRLAAYLEQRLTRYMRYDDRPGNRWRLTVPPEIAGGPAGEAYEAFAMTRTFETYGRLFQPLYDLFADRFPKLTRATPTSSTARRSPRRPATRCGCCYRRGPAQPLGVFATGQSYEQMLIRMRAHPLAEVREYADLMLVELRKVIPAFDLKRVDLPTGGSRVAISERDEGGHPRGHREGDRGHRTWATARP